MESTTTEGAPVAESLLEGPTPLHETQEKRQRQKHATHWQQFTRAQFQAVDSGQNVDANQSN